MANLNDILDSTQISLLELVNLIKSENPMLLEVKPQTLNRFKGYTLKEYREKILQISQVRLAQMINNELIKWGLESQGLVTQGVISDWENGKKMMEYSPRKAWIVRNVYNLTEDEWVEVVDTTISTNIS